ncbi:MAG: DUF4837 family protein [Lentimicrobiaceae bacterium]|jgi:hypothetical protein|nr:DUF4837 family protein [Lentimicrobiaceae bacterium]
MKKTSFYIGIILFIAAFASCISDTEKKIDKPRSVGGTSELLVVVQNQAQWNGEEGEAIRNFFEQEQYGLPQPEPIYKVTNLLVSGFSDMFKKHRNILIVEINPNLEEVTVEAYADFWAKPQHVIKIAAPNDQTWVETFNLRSQSFLDLYMAGERERMMNVYRPTINSKITQALEKDLDIWMAVPEGFYVAKSEKDFIWIRKELIDMSQGIIAYTIPYRDTLDLTQNRLIAVRDSVLKRHIPGPLDGSYMTTDKEFMVPKIFNTGKFVTDFAVESRGMWNVVGDFMGGPFVAYTVVDQERGRLITVEGYVYAPNQNKRNYLLQLESILYSLKIRTFSRK